MIPCCIVDDHCDIVPFLHALWRSKKLSLTNLTYFHIDSHPDLTPPAVNLHSLTNLSLLYDLIENSEGNISEFILPLFINGHLQKIFWLHQSFCSQFSSQTSNYSFYLGNSVSNQKMSVTCQEPYYLDEGLVYGLEELEPQSLHKVELFSYCDTDFPSSSSSFVSLLQNHFPSRDLTTPAHASPLPVTPITTPERQEWILDICLDYFTVSNPFLLKLERHLKEEENGEGLHRYSVVEIISMIQQTILFLPFRCSHAEDCSSFRRTLSDRRSEREQLLNLFTEIMSTSLFPPSDSSLFTRFLELFECSCQVTGIGNHSPQSQAQLFLEMISNLSLPIRESILKSGSSS
jgi:hypothetical protein